MARYGTRQAGSAQSARAERRHRGLPRLGLHRLRQRHRQGRGGPRGMPRAAGGRPAAQLLRQAWTSGRASRARRVSATSRWPRARPRARSRKLPGRRRGWLACARRPAPPTATRCSSCATRARPPSGWPGGPAIKLGEDLDLVEKNAYRFCWIVDFPMYERDEETGKIDFSHNPFSMPQGGLARARDAGPADDQGLPVRHRVQRRRALERGHPQPSARHHVQGLRHRRLQPRGRRGALRRHAERVQVRRAAARRLGAGDRPHRDAAGRRERTSARSSRFR